VLILRLTSIRDEAGHVRKSLGAEMD
jgi:hypothetical protein